MVYEVDPFVRKIYRSNCFPSQVSAPTLSLRLDLGAGIGIVEMLFKSNILGLVGGGKNPKFSTNQFILWDDSIQKSISVTEFRSEIKSVKLRRDRYAKT